MKFRKMIAALSAFAFVLGMTGCDDKKQEEVAYEWGNVAIGGGGYVTGMVYNPTEEGLVYARTDIGGAYRRKAGSNEWKPITDHLGGVESDDWNLIGIESLATDPVEPKRVYIACGTYVGTNGAILSSEDYGETWTTYELPFGCGGNNSGRGSGERLMVNPKDNKEVFFGSRGNGLWRSQDYGKSWAQVESLPVDGTYIQEGNSMGVLWVEFDPTTNDMYVGVAMKDGACVYRTKDNCATWEALPATDKGLFPTQADFASNGKLYLSYADSCGPNASCTTGKVMCYDPAANSFADITPVLDDGHYGGYGGLSVDAQNPDTIVVASLDFWHDNGANFYRTTDGGKTWTSLYDNSAKRYQMDVADAHWLTWGREQASIGWWVSDVNINPFNSDEVMYGTGATIYTTRNMTALDKGETVTIAFDAYGLEETAVYNMISPPHADASTPQLYSIMGDLTGFSHMDVNVRPDDAHFMNYGDASDIDCAWLNPNVAVYASDSKKSAIRYTRDGGKTWEIPPYLPEASVSGKVAVSADGSSFIWTPGALSGQSYITNDFGATWYPCSGLGYGTVIESDKVNPNVYYAVSNGTFSVSTNGGFNFAATGAVLSENTQLYPLTGKEGHIWALSGKTILYSEDSGKTWTSLKTFAANAIGFGAPEKEGDFPVIYALGSESSDSVKGVFRSTDKGATWQQINDEAHQFGNITYAITGDSEIYGRVYFATNGRGIVMGDIAKKE